MPHAKTIVAVVFFLAGFAGCSGSPKPSMEKISNLRVRIETGTTPQFVSKDEGSARLWKLTEQVYTVRQFRPAFFSRDRVTGDADTALRTLANAGSEGLRPEDFQLTELQNRRNTIETADSIAKNEFELQLTYALTRYVSQLCFGRIDPREVDPDWPPIQKICDIPRLVSDALEHNTVGHLAEQLSPRIPEYQGMKLALQRYRNSAGGWQPLSLAEAREKHGSQKPTASSAALSANLIRTGDLEESGNTKGDSDSALKKALGRFQQRHGLDATGRLDEKTIHAMNVPIAQRIEQIEINMDRMRWIADRFEPRHVRVNIPGFQLSVHDGDQVPLQMRVIVGSSENRTPVLDGKIQYLVFSPYWNIPLSIATKELVPKIRKGPNFLQKEKTEVVRVSGDSVQTVDPSRIDWDAISEGSPYQLRQRPGALNALGLVKFIFPNRYDVYLHDTPADNLFDRLTRTLSHGCVRVENPTQLAAYLLGDQPEWTMQHIEEAMHAEKEKKVSLRKALPIHLLYWTAWADSDGQVQFREDVYGYDEIQRELALPAANSADVHVDEIRRGVIPDATDLHR